MRTSLRLFLTMLLGMSMAVPAFAEEGVSSSSSSRGARFDGSCMAQAVTKRDASISSALSPVVTALQTRSTALSAAWNISDVAQRRTALKAATTAFKGTWRTFNTARKQAWKQYATDAKACKTSSTDAPTTTPPMTTDL